MEELEKTDSGHSYKVALEKQLGYEFTGVLQYAPSDSCCKYEIILKINFVETLRNCNRSPIQRSKSLESCCGNQYAARQV
ncbi:hypothetical protein [Trichormus sp. NMC-1]|uniref:hypothetical protein n=1 Tax=Trichormus sp. NMC-1 TaxID=1853259 RepID=UPI0008DBF983|nr:hypothetical protein [Trichormus sp. NMC-1]